MKWMKGPWWVWLLAPAVLLAFLIFAPFTVLPKLSKKGWCYMKRFIFAVLALVGLFAADAFACDGVQRIILSESAGGCCTQQIAVQPILRIQSPYAFRQSFVQPVAFRSRFVSPFRQRVIFRERFIGDSALLNLNVGRLRLRF